MNCRNMLLSQSIGNLDYINFLRPKTGSALVFGLCLPINCSREFMKDDILNTTKTKSLNVSIAFDDTACQAAGEPSRLTLADYFAM